jgi:AcrR family transcriptional regulator
MPATRDEIAATFGGQALRFGYRRASVDDVARALHISKQTIYEHFGTKEGLYRASVELWATQQRQRVESLLTETSALGRITEATTIAFADARRSFEANPYGDATEPPEIVAEVNARVFGPMIRDLIVQGNETGELHVKDPETTAALAVAMGVEAVRMMRDDPSGRTQEAALEAMRRLVAGVVE